jgi:putative nucleotidyltransferase with HDIG domain
VRWSVERAQALAWELLGDGERYRHSERVAERAQELSITVPAADVDLLISAAWLHDIGYAPSVRSTGFHPLDGARELVRRGADTALARLVAHHSGARSVARARGLEKELAEFVPLLGPVADALTAADQTVGPEGAAMSMEERIRDMLDRHGPDSANARAHAVREPQLRATAARVTARLVRLHLTDPRLSSWPWETSAAS